MNKQTALLALAIALLALGAAFFLRSDDDATAPLTEGASMATRETPAAAPETLAPVSASDQREVRIAAQPTGAVVSPVSAAAAGLHPWEGQFAGVTGRLVEVDGSPAAGLGVELIEVDGNMFSEAIYTSLGTDDLVVGKSTSGPDGVFRIEGARGEGFHGLTVDPGGGRSTVRLVEQSLSFGETTDLGDIVLEEHGVAIGTVVDEDGDPVAGARVRLAPVPEVVVQVGILDLRKGAMLAFGDEQVQILSLRQKFLDVMDRLPAATGITDEEGAFRIEGVALGTISGGVDCPGHVCSTIETFEMAGGEHDCGEVELLFGRTARGKVVDAEGKPVAGIEVRAGALHPVFTFGLLQEGVVTDKLGAFEIQTIPEEGTIIGAARRWNGDPWTIAKAVGSGENVTIRLESAATLRVHLARRDGTPVSGAKFRLERPDGIDQGMGVSNELAPMMKRSPARPAASEPEPGMYELPNVPVGEWIVAAEAEGLAPAWAQVDHATDGPPLEIVVHGALTMNLKVIDAVTKEPIGAAHASLVVPGAVLPQAISSGWSNDAGELRLGPFAPDLELPSGAARVRSGVPALVVERPGYAQHHTSLGGIDDVPDETPEGGSTGTLQRTVEMLPGGTITGRVTWGGAPPQDRYMITLELENSEFDEIYVPRLAVTDGEGHFRVSGLVAGGYRATIMERFLGGNPLGLFQLDREPARYATETVTVIAGQETEWNLNLLSDGSVPKGWFEGRVLIDGVPPVGGVVRISENEDTHEIHLDAMGSFRSPDLDPQGYQNVRITIQTPDQNGEMEDEQIYQSWDRVPAGSAKEIVLEYQNTPLRVRVLNAVTGDAVKGAFVSQVTGHNHARSDPTDDDGVASIRLRMGSNEAQAKLRITAEGHVRQDEDVPAAGLPAGLTVRLRPAVPCSGQVILPASHSDDYFLISQVDDPNGGVKTWCQIGDDGAFSTDELGAGTYDAQLMSRNRQGHDLTFVLGPNGDTGVVLDFTDR